MEGRKRKERKKRKGKEKHVKEWVGENKRKSVANDRESDVNEERERVDVYRYKFDENGSFFLISMNLDDVYAIEE